MKKNRNLCYNCFQERETPEGPCPHCGFDLAENEKKFPVALRAGTVLNGRYIIGRVLGQGGFGITYLALDTQLNAKVAIKEFMPNDIATRIGNTVSVAMDTKSEEFTYGAERFQEEARTLAKFIGNPNIAAVTSYFDENDTSYFVMDYIEGISFKTYIANHGGKVSVEDTLNVMIPVLRALTAVHAEGFIHRDVTPDNIYITKDGMVKLLDFGSARYSIGDKSKSLDVILKVGYAPKEQYIRRSRQGPFTDVYSCAACFYAALTGFLPPESLERLDNDTLVPVSQCGVDIPEYLDKAILKGLAVQPEDRFQSAAEFLEAIESRQVVEVPGNTPAQSATSPEKKKVKPALIAGIAAAVVVVLGIGIAIGGGGGGNGAPVSGGNPITEALAPKVTIAGQEYSTSLTELDLGELGLTDADILPLAEMTNLRSLDLGGNNISDLSPLAGLTSLRSLQLSDNNEIADLSPLAGLTEMVSLTLPSRSDLSDLSPVANMKNLRTLKMSGSLGEVPSQIEDLTPLSGLTQLEEVFFAVQSLDDLSPLAGLTNMKVLRLFGSISVTDLSPLRGMSSLEVLQLTNDTGTPYSYYGSSLSPLEDLTHLTTIRLVADGLEDLTALSHLPELTEIQLYGSDARFTDLEPLAGLTELRSLYLPTLASGVSCDISAIAGLKNLETLEISGDLSDLTLLQGLSELTSLRIYSGDTIQDLSPLGNLENLQSLTIYLLPDSVDASPVSHVPDLHLYWQ